MTQREAHPENMADFFGGNPSASTTPHTAESLERGEILEKLESLAEGPTRGGDAPGGTHPPHPPAPLSPNEAAADRLVAAEAEARGLTLGSFRNAMRARASSRLVLGRLDALLEGTPDPVTGKVAQLKPETWDAIRQDVTNRGYGRPHQSLDVTSGGEAITPGVIFLPAPVPLPGPGTDGSVELDEGEDLNPIKLLGPGVQARITAGKRAAELVADGRESGEIPR